MASEAALDLVIKLQADQAEKGLAGLSSHVSALGVAIGTFAGGVALAGIQKLGGAITGFLGDSIQESRDAAAGLAQTTAALKSTGGAANVTADQIVDLAGSLSKTTLYSDDSVQSLENLLLTFTGVKNAAGEGNDIFNQTTKIALDMSAALGTDATSSAISLGKALNDPAKGLTALTRVGVTFTKQQQEQIKTMQASGDTLGAQKIILAELNKEFGGSAAAAAQADGGFHLFQQRLSDVKQTIGDALQPALTTVMGIMAGPVLDAVESLAASFAGKLTTAVQWLATTGIPTAVSVFGSLQSIISLLATGDFQGGIFGLAEDSPFITALFVIRDVGLGVLGSLGTAFGIARDAAITFAQAFTGNWVDASGILPFHQAVGELGLALGDLSRWVVTIGSQLASGDWSGAFSTLTAGISGFASTIATTVGTWADQFIAWIPTAIANVQAALPGIWTAVSTWIADQATPILTQLSIWAQQFVAWVGPAIPLFLEAVGAFGVAIGTAIVNAIPVIAEKVKLWSDMVVDWVENDAWPRLQPKLVQLGTDIANAVAQGVDAAKAAGVKVGTAVSDGVDEGLKQTPQIVTQWAVNTRADIEGKQPEIAASIRKVIQGAVDELAKTLLSETPGKITDWGGQLTSLIANLGPNLLLAAAGLGNQLGQGLIQAVQHANELYTPAAQQIGIAMVVTLATSIGTAVPEIERAAGKLAQALYTKLGEIVGQATAKGVEIGAGIVGGIISGLGDLAGRLAGSIAGALAAAMGRVKTQQKIQSPSRLWADEVGEPLAQGVLSGWAQGWQTANAQIVNSLDSTLAEAQRVAGSGMSIAGPTIADYFGTIADAAAAAGSATSKATDDILGHVKMLGGSGGMPGFTGGSSGMPGYTGGGNADSMPGYGAGQGAGMGFGDGWQQGITQIAPVIEDTTRMTFLNLQNNVLLPWQNDTRTFFSGAGFGFIGAASEGMNSAGGGLAQSAGNVGGAAGAALASGLSGSIPGIVSSVNAINAAIAATLKTNYTVTVNVVQGGGNNSDNVGGGDPWGFRGVGLA